MPWASRPCLDAPLPRRVGGAKGHRPNGQVSLLERGRMSTACQAGCMPIKPLKWGPEAAWHGDLWGCSCQYCPLRGVSGNPISREEHVLPAMGLPGIHRCGRGRAASCSPQSLRAGRPTANAQGWDGPVSGADEMTITYRTRSPISLGPQQSMSPPKPHLWDGNGPCANLL